MTRRVGLTLCNAILVVVALMVASATPVEAQAQANPCAAKAINPCAAKTLNP